MTNRETDGELSSWRREWAGLGGGEGFATAMVARAAKDGRAMRLGAGIEVFGALCSLALSALLVVRRQGAPPVVVVVLAIQLFTGAWLAHYFTLRRSLFEAEGSDVAAFVSVTRKRLETAQRWTTFARRWMATLGLLILPWSVWMFVSHAAAYRAEPWRAVVGFGGAAVVFAGAFAMMVRKSRLVRRQREELERQIAEAELPLERGDPWLPG